MRSVTLHSDLEITLYERTCRIHIGDRVAAFVMAYDLWNPHNRRPESIADIRSRGLVENRWFKRCS